VLVRGGETPGETTARDASAAGPPPAAVGEPDAVEAKQAPVRDEAERKRRRPASGARTAAGWLRPYYSRLSESAGRVSAREREFSRRWWWLPGWAFAAVTIAPALLAVAWLVPGVGMLLAGRLLPLPIVIIFVPLAVALCYFAMRRLPVSWPRFTDTDADVSPVEAAAVAERGQVPLGAVLATVAIAAGFGVWQAFFRSEQLYAVSDPGVYLQYGYWIAGHGTARIPVSAAAFGNVAGLNFATPGFTVSGGSLLPAFLPGLPLVLAAGAWLGGLGGTLLMPAVLGGCAVLAFAGLVGRLCGAWWAVAGALVLSVSLPEVYASRTPFSEPLVQILLFGGLSMFTDSLTPPRLSQGGTAWARRGGLALAGLGGLSLGLTVLASVGSLGVLLPAFPVLAYLFVARRPQAGPFGLGLFFGIGLGLAAALELARAYLASVSAQLHLIGLCAAGFGVVTALVAPLAFPGFRNRAQRVLRGRLRMDGLGGEEVALPSLGTAAQWLAGVLPVLVLVGYLLRPYFQTVRGQADPAVARQVASLQRLEGLPVDGLRQYFESSIDWVLWYLGVPAVILACAGAAVLGRRSVRLLFPSRGAAATPAPSAESDPSASVTSPISVPSPSLAAARLWGLPFLVIAWSVVTVLWDPAVVPWQPMASHRLVPVMLPGLLLLALWVSSRLVSRASLLGASPLAVGLVGTCCLLALAIPPFVTTLNPGLATKVSVGRYSSGVSKLISRVQLRGIGASSTYDGSVAAAARFCSAIGKSASVIFTDAATAANFAPIVRGQCGQPAARLTTGGSAASGASAAAQLDKAVTAIEKAGRRPVILGPSRASVSLFGVVPKHVIILKTQVDAQVLTGPPAGTWPVSYSVWMASPLGLHT
jgi:hypothetical protein